MKRIYRKQLLILAMLVLQPGLLLPVTADPEDLVESWSRYEPDHLVPLDPGKQRNAGLERLAEAIHVDQFYFAGMSCLIEDGADFRGSCLSLHDWNGGRDMGKVDQFMLSCSSAWYRNSVLWTSRTTTVPLPAKIAKRVCALWDKMLLRSRPKEIPSSIFDGVTTVFKTPKGSGSCYQPEKLQSPRLLSQLGDALTDYCESTPETRERLLTEVGKKAAELEKYLESHPQ